MRRLCNTLLIALYALMQFAAPLAAAPVPQAMPDAATIPEASTAALTTAFTYQGRLEKGSELVTAVCAMTFALFDAFTGGSRIGNAQVIDPVHVSGGLFTVALNGGSEFGASAFDGNARFLEIAVLCPGDASAITLPRQSLTAAPYAITSLSAEGLQGRPVSVTAPEPGQALAWNGTQWTPQTLTGGGTPLDWNSLSGIPAGFADNIDNEGAAPDWNTIANLPAGFADDVDNDSGGDITGVTAGSGLTGGGSAGEVALALDTGVTDQRYWQLDGNAEVPAAGFLGTTNNVTLTLGANNAPILRLIPTVDPSDSSSTPSIVGGATINNINVGVTGATIAGGGRPATAQPNLVFDSFGTIGGGSGNLAGSNDADLLNQSYATIAGGNHNEAFGHFSAISGGENNIALGKGSVVGGGANNFATRDFNTIPGGQLAVAHVPGQFAYSTGGFDSQPGSAQMSMYILRNEGEGNLTLRLEGGNLLALRPGVAMAYTMMVVGRTTEGDNVVAAYRLDGAIVGSDIPGTPIFSVPVITTLMETSPFQGDLGVSINTTGGAFNVVSTNFTGINMRWVATVITSEVME